MIRRGQAFAVVLVAIFLVATCSVLLAHAGTVQAEPCDRGPMWAPAKPATDKVVVLLNAAPPPVELAQLSQPAGPIWMAPSDKFDRRAGGALAEPSAPRAPPAA